MVSWGFESYLKKGSYHPRESLAFFSACAVNDDGVEICEFIAVEQLNQSGVPASIFGRRQRQVVRQRNVLDDSSPAIGDVQVLDDALSRGSRRSGGQPKDSPHA